MRAAAYLLTVALAALAGCGVTKSLPLHELPDVAADRLLWRAPPDACCRLVVARDMGFTASAATVHVTVNGQPAGVVHTSERLVLRVGPGRQVVAAMPQAMGSDLHRRPTVLEVQTSPDRPVLVRMGFGDSPQSFAMWVDDGR